MEIKELLLGRENCECGKSHRCPIDYVIISENAFDRIPETIERYKNILLVADRNTYSVCGEPVKKALGDRLADTLIYATNNVLVPNEKALDELKNGCMSSDYGCEKDIEKICSYMESAEA